MKLRKCNVFERAYRASSKNREALATTIFEMQEWNSCDTHSQMSITLSLFFDMEFNWYLKEI